MNSNSIRLPDNVPSVSYLTNFDVCKTNHFRSGKKKYVSFSHGKLYGILPVVANITDGSLEDSLILVLKVKETY